MHQLTLQVLLIEDNPLDAKYIESLLVNHENPALQVTTAETLREGITRLKQSAYDAILLDLLLPDGGWPDSLVHLRGHTPFTPIVVLTKLDEETHGLQAVREGAQDYLVKDRLDANLLVRSIRYSIERQKLLEYMLESEERYALAARAAYDGLWDWNLTSNELFYSTRWKSLLGYSSGEISSRPEEWLERVHPEDLPSMMAALQRGREMAQPVCECEQRVRHKDGSYRWWMVRATSVADAHNKAVRLTGTVTDITARKMAEERLRQSEAYWRSLVANVPDLIVTTDRQGKILYANHLPGGEAPEGAVGLSIFDTLPAGARETVREYLARLFDTGATQEYEFSTPGPHGKLSWYTSRMGGVRDGNTVTQAIIISSEITYRKQAEQELQKAHAAALESTRIKSEFLANMSHEIRTPMNAIIGMTGLLMETALTTEQREYSETVRTSAEALLTLINDILDFSKIEAGKMPLEIHPFTLRTTVESVMELLAETAFNQGVELATLVAPDVPKELRGDAGRIRQVLLNLVNNAVKFAKGGWVTLEVSLLEQTAMEARLLFTVTDTGIGIEPGNLEKLFQAFSQADSSTTRKFGGTGLGLAICRQLVERMSGRIGVESQAGAGSRFWFELLLGKELSSTVQPVPAIAVRRILLADLHPLQERVWTCFLQSHPNIVFDQAPGNPYERLRQAAARGIPFDLAVLDLQPPSRAALAWAEAIRADRNLDGLNLALLVPYGYRDDGAIARIAKLAVLHKPLRTVRLERLLEVAPGAPDIATQIKTLTDTPIPAELAPERHVYRSPQYKDKALRILLAEDNLINQKVTLRQLEKMGYLGDVAANGLEVLEAIKRTVYDIILMDCQMPEMDGYRTTQEIRRRERDSQHVLIVALTANVMEEDRKKCMDVGMDDYLGKPVNKQDLEQLLHKHFGGGSRIRSSVSKAALTPLADPIPPRLRAIAGGNDGLLADLVDLFIRQTRLDLANLGDCVQALAFKKAEQLAHRCAGASANYGWEQLSRRLQELCQVCQAGRADALNTGFAQVQAEFERIQNQLKKKEG